jgi:hypothetical protein
MSLWKKAGGGHVADTIAKKKHKAKRKAELAAPDPPDEDEEPQGDDGAASNAKSAEGGAMKRKKPRVAPVDGAPATPVKRGGRGPDATPPATPPAETPTKQAKKKKKKKEKGPRRVSPPPPLTGLSTVVGHATALAATPPPPPLVTGRNAVTARSLADVRRERRVAACAAAPRPRGFFSKKNKTPATKQLLGFVSKLASHTRELMGEVKAVIDAAAPALAPESPEPAATAAAQGAAILSVYTRVGEIETKLGDMTTMIHNIAAAVGAQDQATRRSGASSHISYTTCYTQLTRISNIYFIMIGVVDSRL